MVRAALADDIPRLIEIRSAVRENRLPDPAMIGAADYAAYVAGGRCWVAEDASAILGFAALDAVAASVWALFVEPAAERRGAGRLLLDTIVGEARRHGLTQLRLSTSPGTRAERLYRAAGWRESGREQDGSVRLFLDLA